MLQINSVNRFFIYSILKINKVYYKKQNNTVLNNKKHNKIKHIKIKRIKIKHIK